VVPRSIPAALFLRCGSTALPGSVICSSDITTIFD
jgi:hypothetical protein